MDPIIETYKEYSIDDSYLQLVKVYDYADLTIRTAANAAHIIRQLYPKGQIELLEYGGFLALDEEDYLLGYAFFSKGGIVQTIVDPQIVYKNVYMSGAKKIIFFHNHPSGNLVPSGADIQNTYLVSSIMQGLGVKYVDHIIVSPLGFYSFANESKEPYIKLTSYAAAGLALKEASIEVYVPEQKLTVSKNNVTEEFYRKNKAVFSGKTATNIVDSFLSRNNLKDTECFGFMALNNALYPDFLYAKPGYSMKSMDDFTELSRMLMSACCIYMIPFVNKPVEGTVAFDGDDSEFLARLGALGSMVGLRFNDVLVRDTNTGSYASMGEQIAEYLNEVLSSQERNDDIGRITTALDFVKMAS